MSIHGCTLPRAALHRSATLPNRRPGRLGAAALLLTLAACGGGDEPAPRARAAQAPASTALGAAPAAAKPGGHASVPAPPVALTIRARGSLSQGVGPMMVVRVNGAVVGTVEVRATSYTDYRFEVRGVGAGTPVDVIYTNDLSVNGEDRNLYVASLTDGTVFLLPDDPHVLYDRGSGAQAFDGIDVLPGSGGMAWSGALRVSWPSVPAPDPLAERRQQAVRFLQQASFGPTPADVDALLAKSPARWIDEQIATPHQPEYASHVNAKYQQGDLYRPGGSKYTTNWVEQKFWASAATAPDQLRRRMAFALHQIFMVSLAEGNLYPHARAYAQYLDLLNKHAFGSFRALMEDIALSPAMGIYLSHMRNQREDPAAGRVPDENFARELMQLFTIGLYELNPDGTLARGADGAVPETYTNADVMALAKVFTGWSWGFPDAELTEANFRWGAPKYTTAADRRIDLQPMKPYPAFHSTAEKTVFAGKRWAINVPAGGSAAQDLRLALDGLARHPNVGPFIGRQLIQHLVASNPSPAYVQRVAAVFDNNGQGVRGDLAAVARAILLDPEARGSAWGPARKLREPVLRTAHWMRALGARSASGEYMVAGALAGAEQRALFAPSVFGYFRPGYVPRSAAFAQQDATAPELQIVNESSVASWINTAETMANSGLGWTGSTVDVAIDHAALAAATGNGNPQRLAQHLDTWLLGGRMSAALRQAIYQAAEGTTGSGTAAGAHRVRAAVFLVLASPEYQVQP